MQRHILTLIICLLAVVAPAQNKVQKSVPTIYVDAGGIMRWSDTKKEASFFGVNYTLPFAHAYRAMGYLGVDRKTAIDRDVYHMARLGLNAYRIHIWDVEISDAEGNLLENEHLELLDYLIHKLQDVVSVPLSRHRLILATVIRNATNPPVAFHPIMINVPFTAMLKLLLHRKSILLLLYAT